MNYLLEDALGKGETENEVKAIKATGEYCHKWYKGLLEIGELAKPMTYGEIDTLAGGFHVGA